MDKFKTATLAERFKIGVERLKSGGAEMGKQVSGKMKEILHGHSQEAKMVEEATLDNLEEPNWGLNLRICNLLNSDELNGSEIVRAIKKRIVGKNTKSQSLSLELLEVCAMNCDKVFSEIASEKVLDDMVKVIDNPQTHYANRQKALQLIEAWGESDDLGYLPIFKQTYMSLKTKRIAVSQHNDRGYASSTLESDPSGEQAVVPPERYLHPNEYQQTTDPGIPAYQGSLLSVEEKKGILAVAKNSMDVLSSMLSSGPNEKTKDDLVISMLDECRESQPVIQRIIETTGDDEPLFFQALDLHDELEQLLAKYDKLGHATTYSGQVLNDSLASASMTFDPPEQKESKEQNTLIVGNNKAIPSTTTGIEQRGNNEATPSTTTDIEQRE